MKMETSRRGLLVGGLAALIVPTAPAIGRASSLMDIRGELLDPWVLAYPIRTPVQPLNGPPVAFQTTSFIRTELFHNVPMSRWKEIIALPRRVRQTTLGGADEYRILRRSKTNSKIWSGTNSYYPETFSQAMHDAKELAAKLGGKDLPPGVYPDTQTKLKGLNSTQGVII
jgi:hypothetical protein